MSVIKTKVTKVDVNWKDIKNECRSTSNKEGTDKEATESFIKKVLISEHSPVRMGHIRWRWEGLASWVVGHFVRHHIGVEKWVSTQRSDRTGVDRHTLPQDAPVNLEMEANSQAIINMGRFRLCRLASTETREQMEDLKVTLHEDPNVAPISDSTVPNCVYRNGCPEFKECGYFIAFRNWCEKNDVEVDWFDIQSRYDAYNKFFYTTHNKTNKE